MAYFASRRKEPKSSRRHWNLCRNIKAEGSLAMNDQPADFDAVASRIDSLAQAGKDLQNEVSQLHSHVTVSTDRTLRFLQRQLYDLKKTLFFAECEIDEHAFNGQFSKHLVWNELRPKLAGNFAVETGTYLGGTTAFLSRSFDRLVTVEVNAEFQAQAKRNVRNTENIDFVLSDSAGFLNDNLPNWAATGSTPDFFYLDAHWEKFCPLQEELRCISRTCPESIVMIDDMEVPGDEGYDFDRYETAVLDRQYLAAVVSEFDLACFVPRLPSAKDCMAKFMIEPRGTWVIAQAASSIAKLEACESLRRI